MTPQEKQIIISVLNTLTHVSYSALVEVRKINNATSQDIELLESNRIAVLELIEKLRTG